MRSDKRLSKAVLCQSFYRHFVRDLNISHGPTTVRNYCDVFALAIWRAAAAAVKGVGRPAGDRQLKTDYLYRQE